MFSRFRRRFWQPPRAHGEVIEDRSVSFLELFYDLVYVAVIARAAHHLASHVTLRGVTEFAVVFGLIWFAWLNGTIYYDLHGREDGRTRTFVFLQMLLLSLLAVFAADTTGSAGAAFALTYAGFLVVLTWLWVSVRRRDSAEFMSLTGRYVGGMVASVIVMVASAPMPDDARLITWAAFVAAWVVGSFLLDRNADEVARSAMRPTESLVERFDLFTIIVLGEVVVGAVSGLSEAEHDVTTIATGMLGLMIGFGIWWTYFDFVGRRPPVPANIMAWQVGHLPVSLAIAASGAAMVSLVEHAGDGRAPQPTAWLLGGAVAVALASLVAITATLEDFKSLPALYRPLSAAMVAGALGALLVAWWRPMPWLLVLAFVSILSVIWLLAINRSWQMSDNPHDAYPGP